MKILLIVPEYPPYQIGGGAEVYENLAREYQSHGHEVSVMFGYYPTHSLFENVRQFSKGGIQFYQLPELPTPRFLPYLKIRMPPNWNSFGQMKLLIQKFQPDVIHLHGYGFIFIDIVAQICHQLDIPYLLTIHGWPIKQKSSNFLIKSVWFIYEKVFLLRTVKNAEQISTVSQFLKDQLNLDLRKKTSVIPNGIDYHSLLPAKQTLNIKKHHHFNENTLLILSLGRLAKIKGFQYVIELLPEFIKKGIDVKYLIAGEDEGYKNDLKHLITELHLEKYVEFIGYTDTKRKKQYLQQVDILAIPSEIEGFSMTALEGMIFNKVILTSNNGGLKEVLKNYPKKVLLNEKNIPDQIKKKMTIKTHFDRRKYNWRDIAKQYLKVLNNLKRYHE